MVFLGAIVSMVFRGKRFLIPLPNTDFLRASRIAVSCCSLVS